MRRIAGVRNSHRYSIFDKNIVTMGVHFCREGVSNAIVADIADIVRNSWLISHCLLQLKSFQVVVKAKECISMVKVGVLLIFVAEFQISVCF